MIKTIALHLADDPRREARQRAALSLAKRHQAAVLAVCPIAPAVAMVYAEAPVGAEIMEAQQRRAAESADKAERAFRAAAAAQQIEAECLVEEGDPASILVRHAGAADLLVLSQGEDGATLGATDDVVLGAPAPTLFIPYAGDFPEFGRHALIAWNGSREAARAMRDALPLLAQAETTTLVTVGLAPDRQPQLERAVKYLARHGVQAKAHKLDGTDIDVGDALLNAIADLSGDLLVMGAYGHSRFRELVLGGATRHVLRRMTAPVLMSR